MPPVQIQIVFFAVIAAFVLFQLYNVLGKKVGRQPEEDARAQPPAPAGPQDPNAPRPTVLDAVTLSSIAGLTARDPNFDPVRFLAELRNRVKPAEAGAEEQVEERRVAEIWTFERILGASDPNWVLARTEPPAA